MSRHRRDASPEYHRDMANQYLYNATRSLAAADDQLDEFKAWMTSLNRMVLTESPSGPYLEALAGWHTDKRWPWQQAQETTPGPQGVRVDEALPRN